MVVTGTGASVQSARDNANRLADGVIIPNVRYRRDIGDQQAAHSFRCHNGSDHRGLAAH